MAEEIKQENTEQTTATRGRKTAERMYSKDELDAMVKAAVAEALKSAQVCHHSLRRAVCKRYDGIYAALGYDCRCGRNR